MNQFLSNLSMHVLLERFPIKEIVVKIQNRNYYLGMNKGFKQLNLVVIVVLDFEFWTSIL